MRGVVAVSILKTIAYKHSLRVMRYLNKTGKTGFTDIEKDLKLNPNVVNMRLKDLIATGLVDKDEAKKYGLTDDGEKALELGEELSEVE